MLERRILSLLALGLVSLLGACASDTASSNGAAVREAINDCEDRLAECEVSIDDCEVDVMDCVESVDGEGATEDDVWKDCEALHELCLSKTDDGAFCDELREACLNCVSGHDDEDSDSDSDTDHDECYEECGAGGEGGDYGYGGEHGYGGDAGEGGSGCGEGGSHGCPDSFCDYGYDEPCDHPDAEYFDGDFYCDGDPSFHCFDNVYVKYGDACELAGKKVYGNVYVEEGGSLWIHDTHVAGNIQSYGATGIEVSACTVGGNVQIKATYCEVEETAVVEHNAVYGNLQVEESYCGFGISGNTVCGDLQFFKNYADTDHTIYDNSIKQNLQCKENSPYPIRGGENRVYGNAEDQCYELARPW